MKSSLRWWSLIILLFAAITSIITISFWNKAHRNIGAYDTKEAIISWPLGGFSYAIYNLNLATGSEFIMKRKYLPFARSLAFGKNYLTGKEASNNCLAHFGTVDTVNENVCRELNDSEKGELKALAEEGRRRVKEMINEHEHSLRQPRMAV